MTRKSRDAGFVAGLALLFAVHFSSAIPAQDGTDSVSGFPRDPIHVAAWPAGKKVAVSFALFVEEFGFGQGPAFRPDLATRNPDLVNEAFRQYAIDWGIARVGRVFKKLDVPLSMAGPIQNEPPAGAGEQAKDDGMLTENVALEDFGRIAVQLEHAGVECQHVLGSGFGGAGGGVAGDRLHVRRQVLRLRGSNRPGERNRRDRHISAACQKQITAHCGPPRASMNVEAQTLTFHRATYFARTG
jgi:hypothetical protein